MNAVLIGGMDRLYRAYMELASSCGVGLKVFSGQERNIEKQLGYADVLILCTGKVSHSARIQVLKHAAENNIPVRMIHSAGVSSLREYIRGNPGASGAYHAQPK